MLNPNEVMNRSADDDARWYSLYRIAAVSALITVVIFLFQIAAYFIWPPPASVAGHFTLLQAHRFVGLVSLDFLIIVDEVLAVPLALALYLSLRRVHESIVLLGTVLSLVSLLCFLIATPALNMLYLSQQYAKATGNLEREQYLAAGQAVISSWLGTPFQVGYVVGSIAMVLIGWAMLRSKDFGKLAGYTGIAASLVGLLIYVPKVGVFLSLLSVVGMQIWYVMIAVTLWRLSGPSAPEHLAA